jgi:hypothetical protein
MFRSYYHIIIKEPISPSIPKRVIIDPAQKFRHRFEFAAAVTRIPA